MTITIERTDRQEMAKACAQAGLLYSPWIHLRGEYRDWCRRLRVPATYVYTDGKRHDQFAMSTRPTGHQMTPETWEAVCTLVGDAIDRKHLRDDTMVMYSSTSYISARRIPRADTSRLVARIYELLEPVGAMEVNCSEIFDVAPGLPWAEIESMSGDCRHELREQSP